MSMGELLLTALVALLVFGPERLPTLARQLGSLVKQANKYRQQAMSFLEEAKLEQQLQENIKKANEADEQYKTAPLPDGRGSDFPT